MGKKGRGVPGLISGLLLGLALAAPSAAQTVPFVEDFDVDESGWADNAGFLLDWSATGGPDGGSYAWGDFDYTGYVPPPLAPDAGPIVYRGEDQNGASGGNFEGDWDAAGVTQVRVWVRHDAPVDLEWILRVANTFNFPALAYDAVDPVVQPNVWTELVFEVEATDPCIPESTNPSFTCLDGLQNVAHIQFGPDAPQQLIDDEVVVNFDVDKVELVPEPARLALWAAGLPTLLWLARRRHARG